MPPVQTPQPETPGQKTMRRFYEGRLAERIMQAMNMAANRALLRRGARKQQDGTLGQPDATSEEEPMNIRIGDEVTNYAATPPAPRPSLASKLAGPALVAASLLSGTLAGGGVSWLLQRSSPPAAPGTVIVEDDQRLGIEVVPGGADRKTNKE